MVSIWDCVNIWCWDKFCHWWLPLEIKNPLWRSPQSSVFHSFILHLTNIYWVPSVIHSTLCCWRRLLRVPWTARRSNQSILKEISHEYSLEGLILKLKLQYFGHLMRRTDSLEKTLMLRKVEGGLKRKIEVEGEGDDREWDDWMASVTRWTWVWASSGSWWWTGKPGVLQSMGSQRVRHDWVTELNWTEPNCENLII